MRLLRSVWLKLRSPLRGSELESDLTDELEDYVAHQTQRYVARGLSPEDARRAALRDSGNLTLVREDVRATWTWRWSDTLLRDLRIAGRALSRAPGFSLMGIVVMALCIGATTSLFTVVRSVLLKPLPFSDPDHLVMIYERHHMNEFPIKYTAVSPGDYYEWREQTHGFEDMAAWEAWSQFNLSGTRVELPEVVHAGAATSNFFSLLGVQAAFGRTFVQAEDHWNADTVVLTWNLFERRFGADPSILGKQIHLDGKPYTIIGVLPQWFVYPDAKVQLWVPYQSITPPQYLHHHAFHQTRVMARMKPDVSLADAVSRVSALQHRLQRQYADQAVCEGAVPRTLNDDLARNVTKPLILLMSAVICMLLIGCLNVANLLVARGAARQKEVAIRGALGAQRLTLIREQMTESFLICFAGGVFGLLLSLMATRWIAYAWKDLPSASLLRLDGNVLTFVCLLVFLAAFSAGLIPAISSTAKTLLSTLQASSRALGGSLSRTALRRGLLTVEVAMTVVLLIAAGSLLKNFVRLRSVNLGCATDNVLTMSYSLPRQRYDTSSKIITFHERLVDSLARMPGVLAVGLGEAVPGAGDVEDDIFTIPEHPSQRAANELLDALIRRADPGYFNALQIPLLSGRSFTRRDRPTSTDPNGASKVIINRQFAREFFPNEDFLGKHLVIPLWNATSYEIVGMVGDTIHRVGAPVRPTIYFVQLSGGDQDGTLVIRTTTTPLALSRPVQQQIATLDPELAVSNVLTMQQIVGESLGGVRFTATLVLAFAVLSLVLASVGLYGVLSYLTAQRATELGIRIALGARREQVLRWMLFDGIRPALLGLVVGLVISAAVTRVIQSMLFGTRPLDPVVFAAVAAILTIVATLACFVPALRASRLDPMQALRSE